MFDDKVGDEGVEFDGVVVVLVAARCRGWMLCEECGEEESLEEEGLRMAVKSTADAERCIRVDRGDKAHERIIAYRGVC